MKTYSESVESKYREWKEKYNIPDRYEFQLKTMFELEEQFQEQPRENVKTKKDILDMIQNISGRLPGNLFEEKKKEEYKPYKQKFKILVVTKDKDINLFNLFEDLLKEKIIISKCSHEEMSITMPKYYLRFMSMGNSKDKYDDFRGLKYNYFINLTNDVLFERTILIPIINASK